MKNLRLLLEQDMRKALLLGLLLRLLLMPFTLHSDILDQYWRSHFLSHHDVWNLPALMIREFGFPSAALLLTDSLHGLWLWLIGPLLPEIHRLFQDGPAAMVILVDLGEHQQAVLHFLSAGPWAWWALFLFKLPYIALEFVALSFLLRLLPEGDTQKRAARFWLLNFVSIFTLSVWGRYDILTAVFLLVALWRIQQGRRSSGFLWLGLGTISKFYPVFFLAPWLVTLSRSLKEAVRLTALYFLIPAILGLLGLALSYDQAGETILNVGYQIKNVVRMQFDLGDVFWNEPFYLYPFIVFYAWMCFYDLYSRRQGLQDAIGSAFGILMLFYALAAFSPQYFFWSLPFLVLCLHRRSDLLPLHVLQVLFFILAMLELGSDLANTFSPLFPELVQAPLQPRHYAKLNHIYPVILGLCRSAFSAVSLFMAWLILWPGAPPPPWERPTENVGGVRELQK